VTPVASPVTRLLAVDGGNSKTDVVLPTVDGTVAAASREPTVSHQPVVGAALLVLNRVAQADQGAVARVRASIAHEALTAGG
jgi:N-acetylglucosamine kinase-like BadF-type ATPase